MLAMLHGVHAVLIAAVHCTDAGYASWGDAVLIAAVHCIDVGNASWGACSVDCCCALHRCWLCFMGCMQC